MSDLALTLTLSEELLEVLAQAVQERLSQTTRWLEIDALADYFQVPVSRVRFWRGLGCPARRVGRRLIFSVAEVSAWLDGRERV